MSMGSPARSAGGTAMAAAGGALLTLGVFVVVFAAFVVAPFVVLAVALLLYAAVRPRHDRTPVADASPTAARYDFGSGAR